MLSPLLMAALVLAQPWNPDDKEGRFARFTSRTDQGRSDRGFDANGLAFFEVFPANQAGSGANCACASVTSAQGGALTMTRASTATCSKQGAATTGIQSGDLVTCAVDKPRVEAGTYLRESSKQNVVLRSQELDNGAWLTAGGVLPTITANQATAPDGTLTAERVQLSAVTAGVNFSVFYQAIPGSTAQACSLYIQGNGTSGTITVDMGSLATCTSCNYVAGSWTRCTNVNTSPASGFFEIGANGTTCNVSQSAADVFIWGAQCEAGTFVSSYIPTTAAAVTRSADSALAGTVAAAGTNFSMAASMAFLKDGSGAPIAFQLGSAAPALASIGTSTNTAAAYTINATSTTPAVSAMNTSTWRASLNDSSGTRTAFWNSGSVAAPAASMVGTATAVSIGALDARTSLVCLDPTPGRCQ